ncbi:MAG: type I pullulanase [Mediterranea sp.]|nr:type I pullulanase [Mediterranea sp.]
MAIIMNSCANQGHKEYASYEQYPTPRGESLTEMEYRRDTTRFTLWAPTAEEVRVRIYDEGDGGETIQIAKLLPHDDGTWTTEVAGDLAGKFYTFNVKIDQQWQGPTPGISARAVGVNGKRGAIIDWDTTNPEGWGDDRRPPVASANDMTVIYEMHHRDFSISPSAGIRNRGKFAALTERGTRSPEGLATGIDHLVELGVTHVHLLPSFDFASIDETRLADNRYNWGYDPQNYNVPDGSYATNPYDPATRIREFKLMVQALHRAGIRVVMDVVYNHTASLDGSNFERTVPGYFYRHKADGTPANGSGCGNETASERAMVRRFMVESVSYWAREYHIDGFRFDLMGVHDIATMNAIRQALTRIDPTICLYGEGWAAEAPSYPADSLAMKANVARMPGIAVFSDELRDGLCGPVSKPAEGGFLAGTPGCEMSVMFGIAGAIRHPQIDMDSVNYTQVAWAAQPTQMIAYVSCHDNLCLADRLRASLPRATPEELTRLDKLAQTVVLTSQGTPFIFAGEEVARSKQGVENSYQSPDAVNAIDWHTLATQADLNAYYRGLIALRKAHPAFRLGDAELVRQYLEFLPTDGTGLIAFRLKDNAGGDTWNNIIVAFNARTTNARLAVPVGKYTVVCKEGAINPDGLGTYTGEEAIVAPQSALIMHGN